MKNEKYKTQSKAVKAAFYRYDKFMSLDASAAQIGAWLWCNQTTGADWRNCSKHSLAKAYAIQDTDPHGNRLPFETLVSVFGTK